ncbi:MAG: HEAT repeat domain-containing protein [Pseudomonadota bacterium]
MGLSFVLGFVVAWRIWSPGSAAPAATVNAPAPAPAPSAGMGQLAALWNDAPATAPAGSLEEIWAKGKSAKDDHQLQMEMQEQLREKAQADPAALRSLIQRFDNERDPKARALLKTVLSNIASPHVVALSARLAASGDAQQRQDAFDMLKQLSSNAPEVRQLLTQAMATEQSPAILSQAIAALTPSVVAAGEADAIVSQLSALAQHADPSVRSQSVLQLGQWDKSAQAEGRLQQALADQAPEVRQAAVTAIGEAGIRSDSMKAALLEIVRNHDASVQLKDGALHALERFSLSKDEFALYSQARTDLDPRLGQ